MAKHVQNANLLAKASKDYANTIYCPMECNDDKNGHAMDEIQVMG